MDKSDPLCGFLYQFPGADLGKDRPLFLLNLNSTGLKGGKRFDFPAIPKKL